MLGSCYNDEVMPNSAAHKLETEADNLRNTGQGLKAVNKYQAAAELYEQAGDPNRAAECIHMVGVSYKIENDLPKALKALHQATDMHQAAGNDEGVGRVARDIGMAYDYRKQFDDGLVWLKRSVEALKDTDNLAELGISEVKLGQHYLETGKLKEAEKWLQQGIASIRQEHHWFYEMTALLPLAGLRLQQKQFNDAISFLWAGIGLIDEAKARPNQSRRLAQLYGLLARGYLETGAVEAAGDYFVKSLKLLEPMADNVAAVVFDDIVAAEFVTSLRQISPDQYQQLLGQVDLDRLKKAA